MIEISTYVDETDEQRGLDVHNAVWPIDRIGIVEARSYRASQLANVDLLARVDGEIAGAAVGSIQPQWPEFVSVFVSVLPQSRRRGAGNALYVAVSDWARERRLDSMETIVADDDPVSLAFAQRRGFVEESHEKGVSLDLTTISMPLGTSTSGGPIRCRSAHVSLSVARSTTALSLIHI